MAWFRNLFSCLVSLNTRPFPQRVQLNFQGDGVSITDNGPKDRLDINISGAPTTGALPGPITINGTGYSLNSYPSIVTTDGSVANLAPPIAIPPSSVVLVRYFLIGKIQTAATTFAGLWDGLNGFSRVGSGAASGGPPSFYVPEPTTPPFVGVGLTGTLGSSSFTIQAQGIGVPPDWTATTYAQGDLVKRSGNTYIVASIAGTGTSVSGPSGTSAGQVDNAGGNQVVWDWLAAGTSVPVTWTLAKLEVMLG